MRETFQLVREVKRRVVTQDGHGWHTETIGRESLTIELTVDIAKLLKSQHNIIWKIKSGANKSTIAGGAIVARVIKSMPMGSGLLGGESGSQTPV